MCMKYVNGYYKRIKFLSLYPILFSGGTHYKACGYQDERISGLDIHPH